MKVIVDNMPDNPSECLFLKNCYEDTCQFDNAVCVFSNWIGNIEEKGRICPYLIELNEVKQYDNL